MKPAGHPAVPAPKIGVLLINLGSPRAPEAKAVRSWLAEFLSDRRVIELSPLLWQPILRGAILPLRPRRSAHAYRQIWTAEGSPLAVITAKQAAGLRERLGDAAIVEHAMRYGGPAIGERIAALKAKGCERILLAPLYPQYCAATTASAVDAAGAAMTRMRWQPALRTLPPYYDDPLYLSALAASLETALAKLDFVPDAIVASFHGMPLRTLEKGDPYHCHCQKTARLLGERIGREVTIAFQSRFGKARWLEPATEPLLVSLALAGKSVALIAPGFAADCLETLEELDIRGRAAFSEAGGRGFAYVPCLNAEGDGMEMLERLVRRELAGWLA